MTKVGEREATRTTPQHLPYITSACSTTVLALSLHWTSVCLMLILPPPLFKATLPVGRLDADGEGDKAELTSQGLGGWIPRSPHPLVA